MTTNPNQKVPKPRFEASPDGQVAGGPGLAPVQGDVRRDGGADGGHPVPLNFNSRSRLGETAMDGRGGSVDTSWPVPGVPPGQR